MISQSNNEVFRKKFANLKELVIKENRLTQNDLNKIFKPFNETSLEISKSKENKNLKTLDMYFKDIESMFKGGQYKEIVNRFRHVFDNTQQPIKPSYLNYLTKSLVKLVIL